MPGDGVTALDLRGEVGTMRVAGGIHATGGAAAAIFVDGGSFTLRDTGVSAADGTAIRLRTTRGVELGNVAAHGTRGDVVVEATAAD